MTTTRLTTPELRQWLFDQVFFDRMAAGEPILGQANFGVGLIATLNEVLIDWVVEHDFTPINLVDLFRHYRQRLQSLNQAEQLQLRIEEPADNPELPSRIQVGEVEDGEEQRRFGWWSDTRTRAVARQDVQLLLFTERLPDLQRALGPDSSLVIFRRIGRPDTWFSGECVSIPPKLIAQLAEVKPQDLQLSRGGKKKIKLPEAGQLHVSNVTVTMRRFELHLPQSECVPLWEIHYPDNPRPLLD